MECYACDQEGIQRCARCGKSYCAEHGIAPPGQACSDCLDPFNAAPSSAVFRASVLGLLAGSVLALWLLVRPPSLPGESSTIRPLSTVAPTEQPSAIPTTTPGTEPSTTAAAEPTPEPTPAETPAPAAIEYTVVDGDTWFGIAGAFDIDAEQLAAYNGRTLEDFIRPGETLLIPQ